MVGTIRVLHVEDNDFFATVAARELESTYDDMSVDRVDCAARALEALEDERFDCIVSDYELPGLNGLELLAEVRTICSSIPFILLTGGGSEAIASRAITSGVTDYFQKSAGVDQFATLGNRISNAVSRRRAEDAVERQVQINDLVWDLSQALLEATTREDIEQSVCEGLSTSTTYNFAWIGAFDSARDAFVPRAVPNDTDHRGDFSLFADANDASATTVGRAIHADDVIVTSDATATFRSGTTDSDTRHLRRAIVPLRYEDATYGALNVYSTRSSAFEETERQTLKKFGNSIAYAIDSVKTRHELRRREQRLQVLNRVLRHNLRNDMTVIMGYAENLIERLESTKPSTEARTIRRKAIEVTEISAKASEVTETLERVDDARRPIDVCALVESRVAAYDEQYAHATITRDVPDEAWIDADPTIGSALDEIIENAMVHNDRDVPAIHVSVTRTSGEPVDRVQICVEDNGPRIPAAEREVLIEGRETALHHSSGLGLWLVNWIVGKYGGEITFDDADPRGNVVTVELRAATPIDVEPPVNR